MRIAPVNVNFNFKGIDKKEAPAESVEISCTDHATDNSIQLIRKYQDAMYFPPYYPTEECHLSEYNLKKLLDSFQKPRVSNYNQIMGMPIRNVRLIGKNSYRGATLVDDLKCVKTLKNAGIERVIDLVGYPKYEEAVKAEGMEYLYPSFNNSSYFWFKQACFMTKNDYFAKAIAWAETPEDRELALKATEKKYNSEVKAGKAEVINYIKFMQKGNFYISCMFGSHLTDQALLVNDVFNPQADCSEIRWSKKEDLLACKEFYSHLTPEDKKQMGWDEEFDKNFFPKINRAIEKIDKK